MLQGFLNAELVRSECCSDRIYDRHCHPHYEVLFVLAGSIRLNVEGQRLLLEENAGLLLEPLKYHIVTGNNTPYHRLLIFFQKDAVPEEILPDFAEAAGQNLVFRSEALAQLFRRFAQILERKDPMYQPLLHAILTEAVYALTFDELSLPTGSDSKNTERLKRIIAFTDENLDREISLADVAAHMYMSPSAVSHLFKQEMRISLKQYILQKKMLYAQSLLYQGAAPGTAAAACGYKNYASFYKTFLKVTGKTPAQIGQEE